MPKNNPKTLAIILAGGRGSRMKSKDTNKTALLFRGKPLLEYGLSLFNRTTESSLVVTGAYAQSVKQVVENFSQRCSTEISTTVQRKRLGTGHAAQVADRYLVKEGIKPELVMLGYGDHLMFYKASTVEKMTKLCAEKEAAIVVVATDVPNPYALGRVVMDETGQILKIVEEKNATDEEKKITMINAALYCFNYDFFHKYLPKLKKNSVSGEYYLTDLIEFAVNDGLKVLPYVLPYQDVGIGVNTEEERIESEKLHAEMNCDC